MFYECRVTNANEQPYSETVRRVISPYISRQHTQREAVVSSCLKLATAMKAHIIVM